MNFRREVMNPEFYTQKDGIASELRKLRLERKLDQAQVAQGIADILDVPKLSATWWAQIENGTRPIPLSKILGVAQFFYPDNIAGFLWNALFNYHAELWTHLYPEPGSKGAQLILWGPDAERIRKLYALPAKTRAAIFELIDSIAIPKEPTSE
jgi:transcriptional regulator with XRE-family HTH domain